LPSFFGLWYPRMPAIRPFFRSRPRRLARPRTPAFHVGNTGSNPVGDTIDKNPYLFMVYSLALPYYVHGLFRFLGQIWGSLGGLLLNGPSAAKELAKWERLRSVQE
jgi:hypothetical protein